MLSILVSVHEIPTNGLAVILGIIQRELVLSVRTEFAFVRDKCKTCRKISTYENTCVWLHRQKSMHSLVIRGTQVVCF